jgi:hypothetical protein
MQADCQSVIITTGNQDVSSPKNGKKYLEKKKERKSF